MLPISDPSAIDEARLRADERCGATSVARLNDVARENGQLVATFACGIR
jgi:hypothetical protein